ncbi:hypothetical protein ACE3MS_30650 [Paenibacillus dendritiformis]|uniref:hypothetical protein n=1 Tax=Paenibacillus dendritiformis TaxID=130049 RepID=UPI0036507B1C
MTTYQPDNSGINSLSGFSFQIRVFVYYMLQLNEGMQIEFETIDDVNIRKIQANQFDKYDGSFFNKITGNNSNTVVQVKRTSITESTTEQVLFNWVLLESSDNEVSTYVLFTDDAYKNVDIMFNRSAEDLFELVQKSNKKASATISRVKKLFQDDFKEFERVYNSIKGKYEFVSSENIDDKIDEACAIIFRKAGINSVVYYYRLKELLQHITVKVMDNINDKRPYIIGYNDFMTLVEDISSRISEQMNNPLYADFKKLHPIDFNDLKIAGSREYKQLLACKLNKVLLEHHLGYGVYYKDLRFRYMETNKLGIIENIEQTTYENFENVKFMLQRENRDEPYNRLDGTKKLENSYALNEQIRYGSCIYLTKDEIIDIQISWKDEEDEKSEI